MNLIQRTILRLFGGAINSPTPADGDLLSYNANNEWQNLSIANAVSIYDIGGIELNDTPALTTSCSGGTWAPTIANEYAVNFGGWAHINVQMSTAAAPSNNGTPFLIIGNLPWDHVNLSVGSAMSGAAYIANTTAGTERGGFAYVADNSNSIRIYQEDLATYSSSESIRVNLSITYRADYP